MSDQNNTPRIALVGHCGPDAFALRSSLRSRFPAATVEMINDQSSLDEALKLESLLLVNRVLDGRFTTGNGIELIESIVKADAASKAMLISNFDDAQAEAQAVGARPGFGKTSMYDASTKERITAALQNDSVA